MSDTLKPWPPRQPSTLPPVRVGALARLRAEIGPKESQARNWGPFIRRVASPFLSPHRLASYGPDGERAGLLYWCAFTVCAMILEELEGRGLVELARQWKKIASGSCTALHRNLDAHGWCWRAGSPMPAALGNGEHVGLPAPGDFCFHGRPGDFEHVDFAAGLDGTTLLHLGGNAAPRGSRIADSVAESSTEGWEKQDDLWLARVPW